MADTGGFSANTGGFSSGTNGLTAETSRLAAGTSGLIADTGALTSDTSALSADTNGFSSGTSALTAYTSGFHHGNRRVPPLPPSLHSLYTSPILPLHSIPILKVERHTKHKQRGEHSLIKSIKKTILIGVAALALTACSAKDEESGTASATASSELEGSVLIDGSGTVYPLMAKLAENYMLDEQEGVSVEVSRAGTSAGFKKFLVKDGTDFNDASRTIKDEETQAAEDAGIDVKELKLALDGLTFVVNKDNDWVDQLTPEQLISIFTADGEVTKWSDLDPSWPDEEIKAMGPNENHGTYEFFYEKVLEEQDLKSSVNLQQDYSTLVSLVSDDKNGIAFFGFGYYAGNQEKLKAVPVDFGNGPVEPSLETIAEDGDYAAFTRPVFTYLNVGHAKEKPQVLDYAKYVLENANKMAGETGFAPIPEAESKENLDFLNSLGDK